VSDELEPLAPAEGVEMYLDHRTPDLSEKSVMNHKYRLDTFVEFCREHGIEDLNDLDGRDLHRYRTWRGRQGISAITLRTNLATLRVFLEFCASIDAVEQGLREKVVLPEVSREEQSRDVKLEESRAESVLEHLDQFEYASRDHLIFAILWHTGIRTGTVQALDVNDLDAERERLRIRHRPETETPLKNGTAAERFITLSAEVTEILSDYMAESRHGVTDEYDRKPLFTTMRGRPAKNSIRRSVYAATRPCTTGRDCPHGEDPDTCEAAQRTNDACKCPSTVSGHPVRRGSITHFLRRDVPEKVVSDRMNVSQDVLDEHYDRRTEDEKAEQRRQFLSNV
jgi:site-specific recombinase XerD